MHVWQGKRSRLSRKVVLTNDRINNGTGLPGLCSGGSDRRLSSWILYRKGCVKMKRSTDTRRSPAEIKADLQSHYGGLADKKPDGHAARQFLHKAYQNYSVRDGDENDYSE